MRIANKVQLGEGSLSMREHGKIYERDSKKTDHKQRGFDIYNRL